MLSNRNNVFSHLVSLKSLGGMFAFNNAITSNNIYLSTDMTFLAMRSVANVVDLVGANFVYHAIFKREADRIFSGSYFIIVCSLVIISSLLAGSRSG